MKLHLNMDLRNSSKKKGRFYIAISWLLARLWWSIEISRLTILRIKPKAVINRITQDQRELPPCHWVLDRNTLYCLGVDDRNDEMIIRETPLIELN
ncbi:MAG: hypothetical protein ACE5JB_02455 [bacterium]